MTKNNETMDKDTCPTCGGPYACFNLPGFGACGPCTFSTCPAMKKDGE